MRNEWEVRWEDADRLREACDAADREQDEVRVPLATLRRYLTDAAWPVPQDLARGTAVLAYCEHVLAQLEVGERARVVTWLHSRFVGEDGAVALLAQLVEFFDGDCRLDHSGACQQHNLGVSCPVPAARRLVG